MSNNVIVHFTGHFKLSNRNTMVNTSGNSGYHVGEFGLSKPTKVHQWEFKSGHLTELLQQYARHGSHWLADGNSD